MPENFDDRLQRHEQILEGLARLWHRQGELNDHFEGFIDEQRAMNQRMDGYMARMDTYTERMDTYMARMNGYMERMEGYMQRQEAVNDSVQDTLSRVQTLLERLPRSGENGRGEP